MTLPHVGIRAVCQTPPRIVGNNRSDLRNTARASRSLSRIPIGWGRDALIQHRLLLGFGASLQNRCSLFSWEKKKPQKYCLSMAAKFA